MIGTDSCPFTPLCERDLVGPALDPEEQAKLEQHLDSGCPVCEERIELHLSGSGELPGADDRRRLSSLLNQALEGADVEMRLGRDAVLQRVREQVRREDAQQARRLRRRHLRAVFYVTNVAATLMMIMAYVGTVAASRLRQRAAQVEATGIEIKALATALSRYAKDHDGQLPASTSELVDALSEEQESGRPYFRFHPFRLIEGGYLDDFGQPLRYRPGAGKAMLYSVGPDGRDDSGSGDDISLWVLFAD